VLSNCGMQPIYVHDIEEAQIYAVRYDVVCRVFLEQFCVHQHARCGRPWSIPHVSPSCGLPWPLRPIARYVQEYWKPNYHMLWQTGCTTFLGETSGTVCTCDDLPRVLFVS